MKLCYTCGVRPRIGAEAGKSSQSYCRECVAIHKANRRAGIYLGPHTDVDEHGITPTERTVLRLMLSDMPNKAIANTLGKGERTIKHHVSELLRKSGCKTSRGLVWWAASHGYTPSMPRPGATSHAGLIPHSDPAAAGEGAGL